MKQSSFVGSPYSTMYLALCLFSFLLAFRLLIFMSWSCPTIQNKFHKYSLFLACFNLFGLLIYFQHNHIILGLSIDFRSLIKDDIFFIFYYLHYRPNLILFQFSVSGQPFYSLRKWRKGVKNAQRHKVSILLNAGTVC